MVQFLRIWKAPSQTEPVAVTLDDKTLTRSAADCEGLSLLSWLRYVLVRLAKLDDRGQRLLGAGPER
jgi:hypothetical protein